MLQEALVSNQSVHYGWNVKNNSLCTFSELMSYQDHILFCCVCHVASPVLMHPSSCRIHCQDCQWLSNQWNQYYSNLWISHCTKVEGPSLSRMSTYLAAHRLLNLSERRMLSDTRQLWCTMWATIWHTNCSIEEDEKVTQSHMMVMPMIPCSISTLTLLMSLALSNTGQTARGLSRMQSSRMCMVF